MRTFVFATLHDGVIIFCNVFCMFDCVSSFYYNDSDTHTKYQEFILSNTL